MYKQGETGTEDDSFTSVPTGHFAILLTPLFQLAPYQLAASQLDRFTFAWLIVDACEGKTTEA
jgi:hypothetical protein